jgi:hypothetical protein
MRRPSANPGEDRKNTMSYPDSTLPLAVPSVPVWTYYLTPRPYVRMLPATAPLATTGQPSPQVADTIATLRAEVRWLERKGRTGQLDAAGATWARGERLPNIHPVAKIIRKAAAQVYESPPPWEPGPVPATLHALWTASTGGGW